MANIEITNIERGNLVIESGGWDDGILEFGAPGTVKAGTILARDSATLKLIPFVKGGGTNENGIPKAVVTRDVVADAAGDEPVRVLVAGRVARQRLVIHADGDDSNLDDEVADQLRNYGIVPIDVEDLSLPDNPQFTGADS